MSMSRSLIIMSRSLIIMLRSLSGICQVRIDSDRSTAYTNSAACVDIVSKYRKGVLQVHGALVDGINVQQYIMQTAHAAAHATGSEVSTTGLVQEGENPIQ